MTNPVFPADLAAIQDSKYFQVDLEDKAIKGEVEGGYVHARPRHTRRPRRTFKTGFTELSQTQFDALVAFYDLVGTYAKFEYLNPATGEQFTVRFGKPFTGKYAGMGLTRLYNVTEIELKEA